MRPSPLSTYLTDHLAGATAGVNLARRVARDGDGADAGQSLAQVASDIEQDRETLKRFMDEAGVRGSALKNATAWLSERAARLKPNGRLSGDPRMHRLHELELLSLGIAGKLALWQALRAAPEAATRGRLDLDALEARARDQRDRVERERIAAARTALFPAPGDLGHDGYRGSSTPHDAG
jgi:hypothetical protein